MHPCNVKRVLCGAYLVPAFNVHELADTLSLTDLQETGKLLSEQLSGVPKSLEHREAISVAQRRRLMVTGILHAVESVHSAEEASTSYATKPAGRFAPCCLYVQASSVRIMCCSLVSMQHEFEPHMSWRIPCTDGVPQHDGR